MNDLEVRDSGFSVFGICSINQYAWMCYLPVRCTPPIKGGERMRESPIKGGERKKSLTREGKKAIPNKGGKERNP